MSEGFAVWLTGLPASGKTTIAKALERELKKRGVNVERLESDELRKALTPKASYSEEERDNFYRAMVFIGWLLVKNGVNVIFDATANKRKYRGEARKRIGKFIEVYVKCRLEECMRRDPKGLYKGALEGRVKNLPGVQARYEEPMNPELVIDTERLSPSEAAKRICEKIMEVIGGGPHQVS